MRSSVNFEWIYLIFENSEKTLDQKYKSKLTTITISDILKTEKQLTTHFAEETTL